MARLVIGGLWRLDWDGVAKLGNAVEAEDIMRASVLAAVVGSG